MNHLIENLAALQTLELHAGRRSPGAARQIDALRKTVPESLLTGFDRSIARGRKPVAVVHNGVCGECHLTLAVGVAGALTFGEELQHCGNCGRFLYLREVEAVLVPEAPGPAKTKVRARRIKQTPIQVTH